MIKFFRKIRKGLLTENKFSKYLIYAIGEIILVVMGILIALQKTILNFDCLFVGLYKVGKIENSLLQDRTAHPLSFLNSMLSTFYRNLSNLLNDLISFNLIKAIALFYRYSKL